MMSAGRFAASALILCVINVLNADIKLPRKHFVKWGDFESNVASDSGQLIWKVMWEFTTDNATTIESSYGPEHAFTIGMDSVRVLVDRFDVSIDFVPVNNFPVIIVGTESSLPGFKQVLYGVKKDTILSLTRRIRRTNDYACTFGPSGLFSLLDSPTTYNNDSELILQRFTDGVFAVEGYLYFLSSNPSVYLWMYECETPTVIDRTTCPTNLTTIKFLYKQGITPDRPEGIPWDRALQDLYQATKLRLEDVDGELRAVYKYMVINNKCK